MHTKQAKLIRKLRRLPANCDFEPPEPEVLQELITGDTSTCAGAMTTRLGSAYREAEAGHLNGRLVRR